MNRQEKINKNFILLNRILLIFGVLIVSIFFVKEFVSFRMNSNFFNEQIYDQAIEEAKIEVDNILDEILSIRAEKYDEYEGILEDRVHYFDIIAKRAVSLMPASSTLQEKRELYISLAYEFNLNEVGYSFFVLDTDGISYLSRVRKDLEGTDISILQDAETGEFYIQEMIDEIALSETNDTIFTYMWLKETGGSLQQKTSYAYYNSTVDLIIGTGVYDDDYTFEVQQELFNRISTYEYDELNYIWVMDYDGNTIYHINENFSKEDLLAIRTTDNESFHETIITELENNDYIYINYYFDFEDLNQEKVGYVRKIEDWDMYIGKSVVIEDLAIEQSDYINTLIPSFIIFNILIIIVLISFLIIFSKIFSSSIFEVQEEFKNQKQIIKDMSFKDQLTGLYNRTYFEDVKLNYNPCSKGVGVVMIDADGLKLINDAFGHAVGDQALIQISNKIKEVFPNGDKFRWGGDEFIVILDQTSMNEMKAIEKIFLEEVSDVNLNKVKISASLGYYIASQCTEDIYQMINNAEKMLYDHKIFSSKSVKHNIIEGLLNTLYDSFNFEKTHANNVKKYSIIIGEAMNLSKENLNKLNLSALLHDIGKISIPDYLLTKKEKLTKAEFEEIKLHTEKGHRILSAYPDLNEYAKYVLSHHEKYNGSGYPQGLKGEDIPLFSRIICVADSFDAMTQDRVYKEKMTKKEAIEELIRCKGTHFDPEIVDIFVKEITKNLIL